MDLLILGGTAFLGRAIAADALARGHHVVCAARGSAAVAPGAALVRVDRDDDAALAPLADRRWDCVVDVSRHPGQVRRAVRDLESDHWVYISSSNAYARFDRLEQTEGAATLAPLADDVMTDTSVYGPAKVACERLVREAPATATIIRSGLIGGSGDASGRVGYYPWRFAHPTGADVLVPPDLDAPIALVDVHDLAAWCVTTAERRLDGTFNATGPTVTLGDVLELSREVADSTTIARPVPVEVLEQQGIGSWMGTPSLPLWIDDPQWRYFATLDTSAARAEGFTTRPLAETLRSALADEESRSTPRASGLGDDEERALRLALDG